MAHLRSVIDLSPMYDVLMKMMETDGVTRDFVVNETNRYVHAYLSTLTINNRSYYDEHLYVDRRIGDVVEAAIHHELEALLSHPSVVRQIGGVDYPVIKGRILEGEKILIELQIPRGMSHE